jgi:tetratricopeptide (TPR) repeat protein
MAISFAVCYAQTEKPQSDPRNPGQKPGSASENSAQEELRTRLDRLQRARTSGDPEEVAHASGLVVAIGLRELGQLRLLESAYSQATEFYGRSLNFENLPNTRVDLAIAYLDARQNDEAITAADQALLDDPTNIRAFQVLARAWTAKSDFQRAVQALQRVAEISPTVENLYNLATVQLASKDGETHKAVEQTFAQMVTVAGDSGSLHVMFGRAYRDSGDLQAALREFQTAVQLDTRTPHAHYFVGLARLAINEWKATPEVKAEFLKELEFYPHDYLANYMTGFVLFGERQYAEANKYLKIAATINPEAPDPWLYLGLNAYALNDMGPAEKDFRKAIELTGSDDSRSNYQIRRAYIDLGRILEISDRKEEAEKYLDKARDLQNRVLRNSQKDMAANYAVNGSESGAALVAPSAETEKAELAPTVAATTDPFAEVDPNAIARANLNDTQKKQAQEEEKQLRAILAEAFGDLGTSEAIRKDYPAALGHFQEAEHWDPGDAHLMRSLGVAAFRVQNYPEAVRGLSGALAANPADGPARAMLGMSYTAEDKYKDAAKTFAPLGEKGMQDAATGYAWALSLTRIGEFPQATEVLQEFEKPERPNDMLMLVGQLWIDIADYARAVATFHRVLQGDPSYPKAHYFAGLASIRWEHWQDAAQEFHAELAVAPSDADAKYHLGFVYLQLSRNAEAEKLFQEVIAADPEHANAQYEYGRMLLDHGKIQDAVGHLEIAARLSPQSDYVHYQLQAAYRKEGRVADADRELTIYKKIKAASRAKASEAIANQTP